MDSQGHKREAYTKREGKSMSISPRELVAGAIEIASLPEIFLKINEMIDSPRHSAADIGRVISNDTALSARLLKIANSVFYGFP